ncbi:MAG: hypothetical protein IPK32_06440 [Verrucomicrobiaceae bacterium]|nr:hypothetical protein [Verrucomicrobiaceae bacterium]
MSNHRLFRLFLLLLATGLLSGCVTSSQIVLDYVPGKGARLWRGQPDFALGAFANRRGIDSRILGRVRSMAGVPGSVHTAVPLEQMTANAFAYALKSRKMLTRRANARYLITGDVLTFDAGLITRPFAHVRVRMNVLEIQSGRVVFTKIYQSDRGNAFQRGHIPPVQEVREIASRALQDVVDDAVDDPEFRSRLQMRYEPLPGPSDGMPQGPMDGPGGRDDLEYPIPQSPRPQTGFF